MRLHLPELTHQLARGGKSWVGSAGPCLGGVGQLLLLPWSFVPTHGHTTYHSTKRETLWLPASNFSLLFPLLCFQKCKHRGCSAGGSQSSLHVPSGRLSQHGAVCVGAGEAQSCSVRSFQGCIVLIPTLWETTPHVPPRTPPLRFILHLQLVTINFNY